MIIAKKDIHDAPVIFNDYAYAVFIKKGRNFSQTDFNKAKKEHARLPSKDKALH